jgi:hypothetical protein
MKILFDARSVYGIVSCAQIKTIMIMNKKIWIYRKKSSSVIGLRREQLSGSASSWPNSDCTPTLLSSPLAPELALGSLEERTCVVGAARSPPVLQARTWRATEPTWR